jgi:hypothetical protein
LASLAGVLARTDGVVSLVLASRPASGAKLFFDHPPLRSNEDIDVAMVVASTPYFLSLSVPIATDGLFSFAEFRVFFGSGRMRDLNDGFSDCSNSINGLHG